MTDRTGHIGELCCCPGGNTIVGTGGAILNSKYRNPRNRKEWQAAVNWAHQQLHQGIRPTLPYANILARGRVRGIVPQGEEQDEEVPELPNGHATASHNRRRLGQSCAAWPACRLS